MSDNAATETSVEDPESANRRLTPPPLIVTPGLPTAEASIASTRLMIVIWPLPGSSVMVSGKTSGIKGDQFDCGRRDVVDGIPEGNQSDGDPVVLVDRRIDRQADQFDRAAVRGAPLERPESALVAEG